MKTKPSRVYLAASMAAEDKLPADSKALIDAHDELHRAWGKAGWPSPTPPELIAAGEAVKADTLANFAMELRKKANDAAHEEWRADRSEKEAA
jgi:hypothetical protein